MIVLDTNVVSEVMRPAPEPAVVTWLNRQDIQTLHLTAVSLAELRFGIARLEEGRTRADLAARLDLMLARVFQGRILPFTEAAATEFAERMALARRGGRAVGFQVHDRGQRGCERLSHRDPRYQPFRGDGACGDQSLGRGGAGVETDPGGSAALHASRAGDATNHACPVEAWRWERPEITAPRGVSRTDHCKGRTTGLARPLRLCGIGHTALPVPPPPLGWLIAGAEIVDIGPGQADIVEHMVIQARQNFARHPHIVPCGHSPDDAAEEAGMGLIGAGRGAARGAIAESW